MKKERPFYRTIYMVYFRYVFRKGMTGPQLPFLFLSFIFKVSLG